MYKKIEKILFILLNVFLSSNIMLFCPILFFSAWFLMIEKNEYLSTLILLGGLSLNLILKIVIFPVIYTIKNKKLNSDAFWQRFKNDKLYKKRILIYAAMLDILFIILNSTTNIGAGFSLYIIAGGGVFTSYLSLLIWYKVVDLCAKK